ncbi:hypothetical protein GCM10023116_19890 [Kistimonas scapharcae]|uniref:Uncharacterized protein n=1 Tax=Kistimonas scapharcae TaxID=1036133 RepID=A0ABP8V0V1_9GAMM
MLTFSNPIVVLARDAPVIVKIIGALFILPDESPSSDGFVMNYFCS